MSLDTVIVAMRDQPLSSGDQRPRVPAMPTRSSNFPTARPGVGRRQGNRQQAFFDTKKAALKAIDVEERAEANHGLRVNNWARSREIDRGLKFETVDVPLAAHVVVTLV